jgi:hypothetical protein
LGARRRQAVRLLPNCENALFGPRKFPHQNTNMNQEPVMTIKPIVFISICALIATPVLAQPAPPAGPKPTKADVQKVIQVIGADKAKLAVYCDMSKLDDQMADAAQKKDQKKLEDLGKQEDALGAKLGPDYMKVMDGLAQVDPNSPLGKDIATLFDGLDKQCPK